MGGSIKKAAGQVARGGLAVFSGGVSEGVNSASKGRLFRATGMSGGPMGTATGAIGRTLGLQNPDGADLPGFAGGQDPATLLAQTGGAPLLANIAMGVDPEDALAGYFGKNKKDGSWEEFLTTLNQKDYDAVTSVQGQLKTIQSNRDLRQQAVDKVINDFPNLTKQAAQARAQSGQEFDEVTRGYMQQALGETAAKFAAGGNLSSGAANEAFAKVGAQQGMQKLDYMGQREQNAYNMGANELNMRLGEVNALRDFQNTMLGGQIQQGFSAQQANLQRQFQGQSQQLDFMNQQKLADKATNNAMLGAIGSLGGSFIGAKMLGANLFGGTGNKDVPSQSPKYSNTYYDSYSGRA